MSKLLTKAESGNLRMPALQEYFGGTHRKLVFWLQPRSNTSVPFLASSQIDLLSARQPSIHFLKSFGIENAVYLPSAVALS